MFEPVWLGNYIVPRWEALAFVGGALALSAIVVVLAIAATVCAVQYVWKQIRF